MEVALATIILLILLVAIVFYEGDESDIFAEKEP